MNNVSYQHSTKNIPYPSNMQYLTTLVSKTEKFISRIRWKLYHIQNPSSPSLNCFGFNTTATAPVIKELQLFEEYLFAIPRSIKFQYKRNSFQSDLQQKVQQIKRSEEIVVKGYKTRNLYSLPVVEYGKLMSNNIMSTEKRM